MTCQIAFNVAFVIPGDVPQHSRMSSSVEGDVAPPHLPHTSDCMLGVFWGCCPTPPKAHNICQDLACFANFECAAMARRLKGTM